LRDNAFRPLDAGGDAAARRPYRLALETLNTYRKGVGGGGPYTTVPSMVELGLEKAGCNVGNAIRRFTDAVNPYMDCIRAGAASYCVFLLPS